MGEAGVGLPDALNSTPLAWGRADSRAKDEAQGSIWAGLLNGYQGSETAFCNAI
jgi:hypothetical protein